MVQENLITKVYKDYDEFNQDIISMKKKGYSWSSRYPNRDDYEDGKPYIHVTYERVR